MTHVFMAVQVKSDNRIIHVFLISFLMTLTICGQNPGINHANSIMYDGLKRTYLLHIPGSTDVNNKKALLIALHGGGGTGKNMVKLTMGGFDKLSDEKGFVVVYPDGLDKHWNDGREYEKPGYRVHRDAIDDSGFISALIDYLTGKMDLDPDRVYITGMSNGAIMAYRLACDLSCKIAAIAPVAGNIPTGYINFCSPAGQVSVLAINNIEDPLVPFEGGDITGPFGRKKLGKVLSAEQSINFWVKNDGCSLSPQVILEPDKDPGDGTRIQKKSYGNGKGNTEVILYEIEGGGHTWPGGYQYLGKWLIGRTSRDIDACEVIWDFFEKHPGEK